MPRRLLLFLLPVLVFAAPPEPAPYTLSTIEGAVRIRWSATLPATSRAWLAAALPEGAPEEAEVALLLVGDGRRLELVVGESTPRALHLTLHTRGERRLLERLTRRDGAPLEFEVTLTAEGMRLRCAAYGVDRHVPTPPPPAGVVALRRRGAVNASLLEVGPASYSRHGEESP